MTGVTTSRNKIHTQKRNNKTSNQVYEWEILNLVSRRKNEKILKIPKLHCMDKNEAKREWDLQE